MSTNILDKASLKILDTLATSFHYDNPAKLEEIDRLLGGKVVGKHILIDEIQSQDHHKVVELKAIRAWEINEKNPIFVEDTALSLLGLSGWPGTYAGEFTQSVDNRKLLCDMASQKNDRRAMARVMLAIYDGDKVHIYQGETAGKIANQPVGTAGFGWDDIFIPEGQKSELTFAQMTGDQKDQLSMRTKAWKALLARPPKLLGKKDLGRAFYFNQIPMAYSFDDVLLAPNASDVISRVEVDLKTEISPKFFLKIPILAINMDTVTGVKMAIAMSKKGGIALMPRFDHPEEQANKIRDVKKSGQRVIAALGLRDDTLARAQMCVKAGADGLTIDVAHGHMTKCLEITSELKRKFKLPVISGVIATYEGAYDLFNAGADAVRVGVGSGTICVTRIVTGCGVPQITAISEAVRAMKKFKNKYVIADGGTKSSGDFVKSLALGASAVITGSLLAGTDEAPGEIVEKGGIFYKEYNGSTSIKEKDRQIEKHNGHKPHFKLHIEGVEAMVKYKGPVSEILDQLCAGIKSGLSYSGAKNIKELWEKAQFIQITGAGLRESGAHDVEVI